MSWKNIPEEKFKAMEKAMEKVEKQYSIKEACYVLKISRQTLTNLIESGKIEATNISNGGTRKNYRISQTALDKFLKPL